MSDETIKRKNLDQYVSLDSLNKIAVTETVNCVRCIGFNVNSMFIGALKGQSLPMGRFRAVDDDMRARSSNDACIAFADNLTLNMYLSGDFK